MTNTHLHIIHRIDDFAKSQDFLNLDTPPTPKESPNVSQYHIQSNLVPRRFQNNSSDHGSSDDGDDKVDKTKGAANTSLFNEKYNTDHNDLSYKHHKVIENDEIDQPQRPYPFLRRKSTNYIDALKLRRKRKTDDLSDNENNNEEEEAEEEEEGKDQVSDDLASYDDDPRLIMRRRNSLPEMNLQETKHALQNLHLKDTDLKSSYLQCKRVDMGDSLKKSTDQQQENNDPLKNCRRKSYSVDMNNDRSRHFKLNRCDSFQYEDFKKHIYDRLNMFKKSGE